MALDRECQLCPTNELERQSLTPFPDEKCHRPLGNIPRLTQNLILPQQTLQVSRHIWRQYKSNIAISSISGTANPVNQRRKTKAEVFGHLTLPHPLVRVGRVATISHSFADRFCSVVKFLIQNEELSTFLKQTRSVDHEHLAIKYISMASRGIRIFDVQISSLPTGPFTVPSIKKPQ